MRSPPPIRSRPLVVSLIGALPCLGLSAQSRPSELPPVATWACEPAEALAWSAPVTRDAVGTAYALTCLHVTEGAPVAATLSLGERAVLPAAASLLCLTHGEAAVSVDISWDGGPGTEPGPVATVEDGTWGAVPVPRVPGPEGGANGRLLIARVSATDDADVYLVASDPLAPLAPEPLLPMLGAHLQQTERYTAALLTWRQYTALRTGWPDAARGLVGEGDALRGLGRTEEARDRYREALRVGASEAAVPELLDPLVGYYANRYAADLEGLVRERLATLATGEDDRQLIAEVAACWPPTPETKRALVEWLVRQRRPFDEQTVHCLITVFDASGDRTTPCLALLPDNQPHLARVSSPTELKLLIAALRLASQVAVGPGAREWTLEESQRIPARWQGAEKLGLAGDVDGAATALCRIGDDYPGTLVQQLTDLCAGQWLHCAGRRAAARAAYSAALRAGGPVADHARLGLAEMDLAGGRYAEASDALRALARAAGDERLRYWSAFRQAQCLEFIGRWEAAEEAYAGASRSGLWSVAAEAAFAQRRLQSLRGLAETADSPSVRYLGEDRSTRGDWYASYGSESFILCAQQAPNDLSGEYGGGLRVTPRTGRPEEPVRHWVSRPTDTHPASLYNPLSRVRRAANWDDRGEAYPRGVGPDLWLEIRVESPSEHRLALYFVNDHHYYEPGRAYTVSVFDGDGRYQTGADVRFFLNGVYQQFAVTGPATLRVLISRNLSMNVLLSGVFLDPLSAPAPPLPRLLAEDREVARAYRVWRAARTPRLDPLGERDAFTRFVAECSGERRRSATAAFLDSLMQSELAARRYGPAWQAAEARAGLLADDRRALVAHLRETVERFSAQSEVFAPGPLQATLPWPCVEQTFVRYLDVGAQGLGAEALARFYRNTAEQYVPEQPRLAGMAYERLAALVGEAGLTPDDHYCMTFAAADAAADAGRLERALSVGPDWPNRDGVELQLLGRYVVAGDAAKAEALVERLRDRAPGAGTAANALYTLGLLHLRLRQTDPAVTCLSTVVADYPDTPWARYAQQHLARLSVAPPQ